jgi:hypothetical protein
MSVFIIADRSHKHPVNPASEHGPDQSDESPYLAYHSDPRVEPGIRQVYQEIDDHDDQGGEKDHR